MRPAWIEVELTAIENNVAAIKSYVGTATGVLAVVKADAYGHGLLPAARAALAGGACMLGVAIPEEAALLRAAGITAPLLILGCSLPEQAAEIIPLNSAAVVSYLAAAESLSAAAKAADTCIKLHVKINTGMGRVGVRWNEALQLIKQVSALPNVELAGLMTHFATADYEDQTSAHTQLARFQQVVDAAAAIGINPQYLHCANSAALTFLPATHFNLVRPGLIIYGLPPVPMASDIPPDTGHEALCPPSKRLDYARQRTAETNDRYLPIKLQPALSLKARVVQLNKLPAGDAVGYSLTYRTTRDSTFALLPLGYADGMSRALSNRGWVLLHGQRAPIAGRISMDQVIVDVTDIPQTAVGDTAVIIGTQGEETITAWEVGLAMSSIAYETLVNLGVRLPRIYR